MSTPARLARRAALAVLVLALAAGAVLWSQGWRLYAVASGSMLPTYEVGELVVVAPVAEVVRGDVVTYPSPEGSRYAVTTHRVVDVEGDALVMQGDANPVADVVPVPAEDVVGAVVLGVPLAGYVVVFLQQPAGVGAVMTALLAMVLLWGLFFPDDEPSGEARGAMAADGVSGAPPRPAVPIPA